MFLPTSPTVDPAETEANCPGDTCPHKKAVKGWIDFHLYMLLAAVAYLSILLGAVHK